MNAVHSMLSEKQVPKVFWPEVVRWLFMFKIGAQQQ